MPTTVTWDDGNGTPATFTVPDDVFGSLDNFRQTLQSFDPASHRMVVNYATVKDMIVGIVVQSIVIPALRLFPTANLQVAQANLEAAQQALTQAQAAVLPTFTQGS
jgi:hypothetical protein